LQKNNSFKIGENRLETPVILCLKFNSNPTAFFTFESILKHNT